MIPVLTKEKAYKLDKDTIESGHLSQAELMDNAGKAVAQFFCEKIKDPFNQKVVVVCGKGNNGGDGVIAHSYLKKYNVSSKIVFTEEKHGHFDLVKKYKISKSDYYIYNNKTKFDKYDWIIDGIFGIGINRTPSDKYKKIFSNINCNKNIISIDLPSGQIPDSTFYHKEFVLNSKHVLTFGFPKLCHFFNPTNSFHIKDIGLKKKLKNKISLIERNDIKQIIKEYKNKNNIHKYNKGYCTMFAGSDLYPGAAILASNAFIKSGGSYVSLFMDCDTDSKIKHNTISNVDNSCPEIIARNLDIFSKDTNYSKNILIGPGFAGLDAYEFTNNLLNNIKESYRYVFDATSFYHIADSECIVDEHNKESFDDYGYAVGDTVKSSHWEYNYDFNVLDKFPEKSILTPHLGELQDITGDLIPSDKTINFHNFNRLSRDIGNRILIYKSFNTFIITKDMIYIMDEGPSLLATAGTGDVLSGILVSLLSQGYSRLEASILGTYLHAEAANYYMNNISKDGMTASDLIDCIPHAFNALRKND